MTNLNGKWPTGTWFQRRLFLIRTENLRLAMERTDSPLLLEMPDYYEQKVL